MYFPFIVCICWEAFSSAFARNNSKQQICGNAKIQRNYFHLSSKSSIARDAHLSVLWRWNRQRRRHTTENHLGLPGFEWLRWVPCRQVDASQTHSVDSRYTKNSASWGKRMMFVCKRIHVFASVCLPPNHFTLHLMVGGLENFCTCSSFAKMNGKKGFFV